MRTHPRVNAAIALALSVLAGPAAAQSLPLSPPTLEPTLKVFPTPQVEQRQATPAPAASCICTAQYDPVCALTPGGTWLTYSNACRAACDRATDARPGPC